MDKKDIESGMNDVKEICKKFEEVVKSELSKGIEQVDTHEMGMVVDMMKDCACALKDKAKLLYYMKIIEEMDEAKENAEFDEKIAMATGDEPRFYNGNRYANGRYAPSGYGNRQIRGRRGYSDYMKMPEVYDYTDDFMKNRGRLYYDSGNMSQNTGNYGTLGNSYHTTESRYDRARRGYTESKTMHNSNSSEDKAENLRQLESFMQELGNDMTELVGNMTADEKNTLKNRLNQLSAKIQ